MRGAAIVGIVVAGAIACGTFLDRSSEDSPPPKPAAPTTAPDGAAPNPDGGGGATGSVAAPGSLSLGAACTSSKECESGRCKAVEGGDGFSGACVSATDCSIAPRSEDAGDKQGGTVFPKIDCSALTCCLDHYCRGPDPIIGEQTDGCARCGLEDEPCEPRNIDACCGTARCNEITKTCKKLVVQSSSSSSGDTTNSSGLPPRR